MTTLHVVIPVYNERETLRACIDRVLGSSLPSGWERALYIVDDESEPACRDAARSLVEELQGAGHAISLRRHEVNRGKGAALQTGFDAILAGETADDDLVVIQDADLEYDPNDYTDLLKPLRDGLADVTIGTRWGRHRQQQGAKRRIHELGNRALTMMSNLMTGFYVSDMECCYKMFSVSVLRRVRPMLTEERFGVEPQMVAGFSRLKLRVIEVPVQYDPRGLAAGKKIGWRDGVRAIMVIARERFRRAPGASDDNEAQS